MVERFKKLNECVEDYSCFICTFFFLKLNLRSENIVLELILGWLVGFFCFFSYLNFIVWRGEKEKERGERDFVVRCFRRGRRMELNLIEFYLFDVLGGVKE